MKSKRAAIGWILALVPLLTSLTPADATESRFRYVTTGSPFTNCDTGVGDAHGLGGNLTNGSACTPASPGNVFSVSVVDDVFGRALPIGFTVRTRAGSVPFGNPWTGCGSVSGLVAPGGTQSIWVSVDSIRNAADVHCSIPTFGTTGIITINVS